MAAQVLVIDLPFGDMYVVHHRRIISTKKSLRHHHRVLPSEKPAKDVNCCVYVFK